ncbi:MAG: Serine phosphatase RsbU, regulator of sigma subunit, partial [Bacteroidetes bacterium 38_7]
MVYIKKSLLIFLSLYLLIQIQWVSAQNFSRYDSLLRIYEVNRNLGVNKEIQIKNLIDLSTEITLSNPDKAIQFLQSAIQLVEEIGNKQKEAEISSLLGDLYLEKMFVFNAMDSYLKSYLIYRDAGQLKEMAWALINIGNVSYAQHIYDYPMQNYRLAYKIFSQINDQYGMSVALNNLGICKREMLELDSALYYMNQALQLREKLGNSLHVAYSLTYIASVYLKKQDYTKTLETIDKAMSLLNSVYPKENREADGLRISLYILKGEVRFSQGDDVSALQNLNSGLQIAENLKSDRYKVEILGKLIMVYQGKADFLQAIEINKQRIALCRKINLIDCTIEAYREMGELYNRIGVFDSAIQNYRKSLYYSDSIRFVRARNNFYDIGQAFRIYSLEQQEKVILQRMQRGQLFLGVGIIIILITGIFLLIHLRRIRNARREFETLSEAAFEGIVIHDRGLILSSNSRFSQMLKMTPEDLKGKDLYDFVVENDRQRVIELSRDN